MKSPQRQSQNKKSGFKHHPAVAKFKAFCGRLNSRQKKTFCYLKKGKTRCVLSFVKKNITRAGILACALFVSLVNLKSQNKNLFGRNSLFRQDNSIIPIHSKIEKSNSLATAQIADAYELAEYEQFLKEEGEKNTVLGAITAVTNPTSEEFQTSGDDVFIYKVQQGDTLSTIAQKYSVTVNTILWANDLTEESTIKPDDEIFVLPITGVKHKVKNGDTVKTLAKKYKAKKEKIISFNDLPANGELKVGEVVVIPDGEQENQPRYRDAQASQFATKNNLDPSVLQPIPSSGKLNQYPAHRFPYGWCTWYVASRRHVPWGGNAGTWLYHARAYGASTGKTPQKGAIIVTRESRWGHVGIVESVKSGSVTISEMNYKGWGVKSKRTISTSSPVIQGYIY